MSIHQDAALPSYPGSLQRGVESMLAPVQSATGVVDMPWLLATLLVATRLGALALLSPAFGGSMVPGVVRVMLVLALSAVLASGFGVQAGPPAPVPPEVTGLLVAMAREASLGATLALGVSIAFAAFAFGARIVDLQIGFGLGQIFDPSTRQATPVFGALAGWLALVTFFLADAHHGLMRGLAMSLEAIPPGAPWGIESLLPDVARAAARMSSLGFAMFAPVVLCLLAVEVALGLASRSLPQMNTLVVGAPLKVFAGVAAMTVLATSVSWPLQRMHSVAFQMWSGLWR